MNVSIAGRNTFGISTIDQDQKVVPWVHHICKTSQSLLVINDEDPTIDETKYAIKHSKIGKAAGPDEIIVEAIKAGGKPILRRLRPLLRMVWHSNIILNTWKKGLIVPLFKKGDNREWKNYHGISLLSAVGKVFMKVI